MTFILMQLGASMFVVGLAGTAIGVFLTEPEGIALRVVQGFYATGAAGCLIGMIAAVVEIGSKL